MPQGANRRNVQVLPLRGTGPLLPIVEGEGSARAVVWLGSGATERSVHHIRLGPSSSTVRLAHGTEGVYYVLAGSGAVVGDGPRAQYPLIPGSMVHVSCGVGYRFTAGTDGLEFLGGPCPPDPALYPGADGRGNGPESGREHGGERGAASQGTRPAAAPSITVLHQDEPALMLPLISADARMIVWPGMGAWTATMNYVRMRAGEENSAHAHEESEDTIVILEGRGSIDDISNGRTYEFRAGDVIHVPPKLRHAVRANRGEHVVSVGGPSPVDLAFLRLCGAEIPERSHLVPGPDGRQDPADDPGAGVAADHEV